MIEVIIFDIDGTLIDSVDLHARSWQETLSHFGHDFPFERVRHQIGKGGDQLMPALLPNDVVERRGKEIEAYRSEQFKKEYLSQVRPFPRVRELFERIQAAGLRIALASSAKGDELEKYKEIADIEGFGDAETSSDDAEKSKPHPDIFEAALEQLGDVDPRNGIVIGDIPYDAEAAGKAGLRTIGVLCGGFPEEELRAAGCFAIYRDPADLLEHYDESPAGEEGGPVRHQNPDLHGNAPDKADAALLLIDVINDLEFPEGEQLLEHALPMARRIVELKKRAKKAGIPTIYVNDNFGRWQSDFHVQVEHCLHDDVTGRPLAERLVPDQDDYFVLKPKHSGFFSTTLDTLLEYLQVKAVILAGVAGNICVLFTANDAYMRDFRLFVPGDCVASNTEEENRHALEQMARVLKADTRASTELELETIAR